MSTARRRASRVLSGVTSTPFSRRQRSSTAVVRCAKLTPVSFQTPRRRSKLARLCKMSIVASGEQTTARAFETTRRRRRPWPTPAGTTGRAGVGTATPCSMGLPRLPASPFQRAGPLPRRIEEGARVGCFPDPARPSSNLRQAGIRDFTFEACSGFTRVTARRIAQPPQAAFEARLRPGRLPARPLAGY